jgi:multidrug efflux pump subunit AcrB
MGSRAVRRLGQTAVVYVSYVNEPARSGLSIPEATREAAILRLRPIAMAALVAALGFRPPIDRCRLRLQRPFALVSSAASSRGF